MSEPPDLESLARRFLDLWQDQMTAMAGDPETAEIMTRLMAMGAPGLAAFMPLAGAPPGTAEGGAAAAQGSSDEGKSERDTASRSGGRKPKAKAGTAAASASSGGGGLDLDELARRLEDVERRLAELEAGASRGASGRNTGREAGRKPRRRSS